MQELLKSAHLSVLMIVHNFSTQYSIEQFLPRWNYLYVYPTHKQAYLSSCFVNFLSIVFTLCYS